MTTLRVGSVCTGSGGFELGFHRAGLPDAHFEPAWLCEWEPWRRTVLARHFPGVPIYPDITEVDPDAVPPIDVLVGGTPCQDLSVAGRRAGLDGERSGLFHHFVRLRNALNPEWTVWENVPGALSSNAGLDFGVVLESFVGAPVPVPTGGWPRSGVVAGPWGGAAWRILNSQHFGVPQRRNRIFVVGRLGGPVPPEVLLERGGREGDLAEGVEAWSDAADGAVRELEGAGGVGARAGASRGRAAEGAPGIGAAVGGSADEPDVARAVQAGPMGHRHDESAANYVLDSAGGLADDSGELAGSLGAGGDTGGHRLDLDSAGAYPAHVENTQALTASFGNRGIDLPDAEAGWIVGEHSPEQAAPLTSGSHPGSNAPGRRQEDDVNLVAEGKSAEAYHAYHGYRQPDEGVQTLTGGASGGEMSLHDGPIIREEPPSETAPCLRSNPHNNSDPTMEAQMLVHREEPADTAAGLTARYGKGPDSDATDALVHGKPVPFVKRHGAANPEDYESWEHGETARSLNSLGQAGTNGALAVEGVTGDQSHALTAEGFDASEDGTGRGTPIVADQAGTVRSHMRPGSNSADVVAFEQNQVRVTEQAGSLQSQQGSKMETRLASQATVRRLTPTECERLQGFPDGWTIPANEGSLVDAPSHYHLFRVPPWERGGVAEAFVGGDAVDAPARAHAFYSTGGSHGLERHEELSPPLKVGSGLGIGAPPAVARQEPSCIHADAIGRDGVAQTDSPDAEGRMRKRDAGLGVSDDGQAYNLTTGAPHAVGPVEGVDVYSVRGRDGEVNVEPTDLPNLRGHTGKGGGGQHQFVHDRRDDQTAYRMTGDYADPQLVEDDNPMLTANPMSDRVPFVGPKPDALDEDVSPALTSSPGFAAGCGHSNGDDATLAASHALQRREGPEVHATIRTDNTGSGGDPIRHDGQTESLTKASPPAVVYDGEPVAYDDRNQAASEGTHHTLRADGGLKSSDHVMVPEPQAFETRVARNGRGAPSDQVPSLKAQAGGTGKGDGAPMVMGASDQGGIDEPFDPKPDGARYAAMGDAVTVPVLSFIGRRVLLCHLERDPDTGEAMTFRSHDG